MEILWSRNITAGALHMFNFITCFYLALTNTNIKAFKIGLTTLFLDWNKATKSVTQKLEVQYELPFVLSISFFALISALAHGTCLLFWDKYTEDLKKGLNRFRWWEYALSSSLMIVQICMLFGVWDIFSLVFIACINAGMNLFGDIHELLNAGR